HRGRPAHHAHGRPHRDRRTRRRALRLRAAGGLLARGARDAAAPRMEPVRLAPLRRAALRAVGPRPPGPGPRPVDGGRARPPLGLAPLGVFAAERRWRVVAGAAAVGAAWAAATALLIGWRTLFDFLALGPLLSRMIFEPGMPSALFCSIYALFLLPLGPGRF